MSEPNVWYLAIDKYIEGNPIKPFVVVPRVEPFRMFKVTGTGYVKATATRLIVKVSVKTGRGGRRGRARRAHRANVMQARCDMNMRETFDRAMRELSALQVRLLGRHSARLLY